MDGCAPLSNCPLKTNSKKITRCLIVDDEKLARQEMARLLEQHANVEIVGEASRVDDALELTARLRPEVVFLDIKLRHEDGFDFVFRSPAA